MAGFALPTLLTGQRDNSQDLSVGPRPLLPTLVKDFTEYQHPQLLAISGDGLELCFYLPLLRHGTVAIVKAGTWQETYTGRLRFRTNTASFFGDNDTVYVESWNLETHDWAQTLIGVRDGTRTDRQTSWTADNPEAHFAYEALQGPVLLALERSLNVPIALALVGLPTYEPTIQVPFSINYPSDGGDRSDIVTLSSNKRWIIHTDNLLTIVCRRTEDLSVVWTQELAHRFFAIAMLSATPDGACIGAVVLDKSPRVYEKGHYYLAVYSGSDGKLLGLHLLTGISRPVISPGGRFFAGTEVKAISAKEAELNVVICDLLSGARLAKVTHDRFKFKKSPMLNTHSTGTVQFTADGKYLISSNAYSLKCWEM
jgi:hypothetical protein